MWVLFFFSSRRRHTRSKRDWSSDVCSSDLPRVMRLLSDENIALCISDHADAPSPWKRTADFAYVRGHGPGGRYKGHYSAAALTSWARKVKQWRARGRD